MQMCRLRAHRIRSYPQPKRPAMPQVYLCGQPLAPAVAVIAPSQKNRIGIKCSASGAAGSGGSSSRAASPSSSTPPPPPLPPQQSAPSPPSSPWSVTNYFTKKQSRNTDSLGNIITNPDTIAEPPGWTPDAQLRLAAEVLAPGLQRDAAELLEQVRQLQELLPGMQAALRRMQPAELVRMAAQLEQITQQLIALKDRFPTADVAAMVAAHPPLLQMPPEQLDAAVAAVQEAFPEASQEDVEAMLSSNACLLDGGVSLRQCLAGVGHLLSRPQIMRCLQRDPTFLYQFQPLEGQARGDRDAEYLADMFKAN